MFTSVLSTVSDTSSLHIYLCLVHCVRYLLPPYLPLYSPICQLPPPSMFTSVYSLLCQLPPPSMFTSVYSLLCQLPPPSMFTSVQSNLSATSSLHVYLCLVHFRYLLPPYLPLFSPLCQIPPPPPCLPLFSTLCQIPPPPHVYLCLVHFVSYLLPTCLPLFSPLCQIPPRSIFTSLQSTLSVTSSLHICLYFIHFFIFLISHIYQCLIHFVSYLLPPHLPLFSSTPLSMFTFVPNTQSDFSTFHIYLCSMYFIS